MSVEGYCKNCEYYYRFNDDDGGLLTQGCELDLPHFKIDKLVICNSYIQGD